MMQSFALNERKYFLRNLIWTQVAAQVAFLPFLWNVFGLNFWMKQQNFSEGNVLEHKSAMPTEAWLLSPANGRAS